MKKKLKELEEENSILRQQHVEITEAKELYLKIFEEFPALIWRSRLDKLCDYFNKTWLDFTGRTMEQEFGNGWAEGVHPDDFDFCLKTYVAAFDKRESFLMEYRMKNYTGAYRWIRDFGRPFYDLDNTFLGYIGSCYDITDNKNNELKLIELNTTKDKFFSIIAH
ncbi:MAG: PAS domain-containing protein, partial [Prolixibacteraceae bacterium]